MDDWSWSSDSDEGFGCWPVVAFVTLIALFLLAAIVFGFLRVHGKQIVIGLASIAAVVAVVYAAMMRTSQGPKLGGLPMPLADIKPGVVHTAGLVGFSDPPRNAPFGAPPCVFYRVVVEENDKLVFEGRSVDAIQLGDGASAKLVVHLDGATWQLGRAHDATSDEVQQYLASRGLPAHPGVRVRVEWVAPHELVFVRGTVSEQRTAASSEYRSTEGVLLEMKAPVIGLAPLA
jgi:hypothetical protein